MKRFAEWVSRDAKEVLARIDQWIPEGHHQSAREFAQECIRDLRDNKPATEDALLAGEEDLLEFLFGRGFLPAYAFPRDLVTLQVERMDGVRPATDERTQQSANVALSEYAPGRLVVVNKKTYRIGAVTASTPPTEGAPCTQIVSQSCRLLAMRKLSVHRRSERRADGRKMPSLSQ